MVPLNTSIPAENLHQTDSGRSDFLGTARLAQSVERETLKEHLRNLKVVGSTPTSGSIPVVDDPLDLLFL